MAKKSTSDYLKTFLAEHPFAGGKEADWKRVAKSKDEQGRLVREFKNSATGQHLVMTEVAEGQYMIAQKAPSNAPVSFFPAIEKDPAKIKAADEAMKLLLDMEEAPDALLKKAGKALANKFCFAYGDSPDGPFWNISPISEGTDAVDDREFPIGHLMPKNAGEVMEATWVFEPEPLNPFERAVDLMQRGFIWDEQFQQLVDNTQVKLVHSIRQARAAELAAQNKPSGPRP